VERQKIGLRLELMTQSSQGEAIVISFYSYITSAIIKGEAILISFYNGITFVIIGLHLVTQ
jgi:hypothetical protein